MRRVLLLIAALCLHPLFGANDARPVVGPGASKDEVIKAYGWPNGMSQSGNKEIYSYAQGEVILENGRVERVNFSPDVPWQAPRPKPPPATASTRKLPEVPVDFWLTDFTAATIEAKKRHARILALFSGSDWSPPSRQFHEEVEFSPDFVNAFAGDFVFLKLDYPRGNPVPAKISDEKQALRDRYGVTTYPTLLVLSEDGERLAQADLARSEPGSFRDRVIVAVREARDASGGTVTMSSPSVLPPATPTSSETPVTAPATPAPASSVSRETVADTAAGRAMSTAGKVIALALVVGGGLVGFFLWKLWRQNQPKLEVPVLEMADRIDAAAGGMPSQTEMMGWSKLKLCAITAALAEFDNYSAHIRPPGDIDIELRKRGDVNPRVLVCVASGTGVVPTKRLRELFASLAAEGVETGWFVSPAGFVAEARSYAAAHRIVLLNAEGLHNLMREVPPVSLPAVLARSGE